jgi:hypothetical protein
MHDAHANTLACIRHIREDLICLDRSMEKTGSFQMSTTRFVPRAVTRNVKLQRFAGTIRWFRTAVRIIPWYAGKHQPASLCRDRLQKSETSKIKDPLRANPLIWRYIQPRILSSRRALSSFATGTNRDSIDQRKVIRQMASRLSRDLPIGSGLFVQAFKPSKTLFQTSLLICGIGSRSLKHVIMPTKYIKLI